MTPEPVALTIAGVDPAGHAGLTVDLATFASAGVRGVAAVTALTVQSPGAVDQYPTSADVLARQLAAVTPVDATKTGMLVSAELVRAVIAAADAGGLGRLVVDPVRRASGGGDLVDDAGFALVRDELVPRATLVTPNLEEAAALAGTAPIVDRAAMVTAAARLGGLGAGGVLVTGGHLPGDESPDLLWVDGVERWFEGERLPGDRRGTGCRLSAGIAAALARGAEPADAVTEARRRLRESW